MYQASDSRYDTMEYKRCGRSGILLPRLSLGLWQNFSSESPLERQKELICRAFDMGITHFDLANNYGHPYRGTAEENFGKILKDELSSYRDEMIIATKAGYDMWPGPYGNWGSRKYLIASLDQSLKRMGLDYVDIYYHHRPDPETPLEETAEALSHIVRSGKALYIGISNYREEETAQILSILRENKTPCLIHQLRYNMLERWPEKRLLRMLDEAGTGCIAYSPLAQGTLTDKYLSGIPQGSRASKAGTSIQERYFSEKNLEAVRNLAGIAAERGQSMAQMALAWVMARKEVTSVLIGVSRVEQLEDNLAVLKNRSFTQDEEKRINAILEEI